MNKDILFYSNFCEYSKHILVLVQKKDCRDSFVMVCVDNPAVRNRLPVEVDKVPMIITKTKHVISGDNIVKYIETFACMNSSSSGGKQKESNHAPQQQAQQQNPNNPSTNHTSQSPSDPSAFSFDTGMNTFSDSYTFINNEHTTQDHTMQNFGLFGNGVTQQAYQAQGHNHDLSARIDNEKKSKVDEAYEKYISDRDADITRIFGNKRPTQPVL
jgi:hypothetical protein